MKLPRKGLRAVLNMCTAQSRIQDPELKSAGTGMNGTHLKSTPLSERNVDLPNILTSTSSRPAARNLTCSACMNSYNSSTAYSGTIITINENNEHSRVVDPDPDPYWESGSESRGKKMKKFQWKKELFSYF
jgi:hypothetical protein